MADFHQIWLLPFLAILALLHRSRVDSLQCYSCKATGSNELDANIKCLENAYLENCEEFYDYYNEIEDQDVISYEYYYYDKPDDNQVGDKTGNSRGGPTEAKDLAPVRGRGGESTGAVARGPNRRDEFNSPQRNKRAAEKNNKKTENKKADENKAAYDYKDEEDYPEYYYEYEYVDDNVTSTEASKFNDQDVTGTKGRTTGRDKKKDDKKKDDDKKNSKKDTKPQHYCYSQAFKSSWESYTVEKGCKKISYCKNAVENKPEWIHPWNFCCDRSRCNVKLVKDKPQRVFGMGCRRQDDCIQGHISRSLCPHYFKSCPRISSSMIKMECRVKARTMGAVKNGPKYRHQFREKKCYCSKGYYPRGPICTSGGLRVSTSVLGNLVLVFAAWAWQ